MKHTPGPWREGISSGAIVTDCPTPGDCRACSEGGAAFYGGHIVCESAEVRDRPILKAAPDLLAALKGLMGPIERAEAMEDAPDIDGLLIDAARAAIRKATGKTP